MKRSVAIVVVLILCFGLSAFAAPRLTIEEPKFDFGFVPQHSKISYPFMLYSTGDTELRILKVKPG